MGPTFLVSLERMRDAFRGLRRYNTPCRLDPPPRFPVHLVGAAGGAIAIDNQVPAVLEPGSNIHRPMPGREDCPICRELAPSVEGGIVERPTVARLELGGTVLPIGSDSPYRLDPGVLALCTSGQEQTCRAAASYTAKTAMEEIRQARAERLDEQMATLLRQGYEPAEGPTSACFGCGRNVAPADLWVGKKSGIALGDCCMAKWEKAGRARRTGEF